MQKENKLLKKRLKIIEKAMENLNLNFENLQQ
jgi:hypothetical protein